MPRPSSTLKLGDPAPDFELVCAVSGEPIELKELLNERTGLLLVFHRGLW